MKDLIDSFDAPSYLKYFILPTIIFMLIGYVIGFPFFIKSFTSGGYDIKKYDSDCKNKNIIFCEKNNYYHEDINECINYRNRLLCDYTWVKTGKYIPLIVYLIIPLLVAIILSGTLYNIMINIKNPRLAAGRFILNGIFNSRSTNKNKHHYRRVKVF